MMSRWIRVGCDFRYVAEIDTPVIFQVQPGESANVALKDEQWSPGPAMELHRYTDLYGNPCTRAVLPAGRSSFRYHAVAVAPDATEDADQAAPVCPAGALPDAAVDCRGRQHGRARGLPGLHPSGDLVLPRAEHSGPLCLRIPAGHGRPAEPRADGLRRLDGSLAR